MVNAGESDAGLERDGVIAVFVLRVAAAVRGPAWVGWVTGGGVCRAEEGFEDSA